MDLYINTADLNSVHFQLKDKKTVVAETTLTIPYNQSNATLELLSKFLTKHKVTKASTIYISNGPGSYTGLRVGASIAQGLALAWNAKIKTLV